MKQPQDYMKVSDETDLLNELVGKICIGQKRSGKKFTSLFVKIDGDDLYFSTKAGRIIMNKRENLLSLREYIFFDEEAV